MSGEHVTVAVPGRVNLIGDHTDYSGGLALPMAIDRWTVVSGVRSDSIELRSQSEDGVARFPAAGRVHGWTRHVEAVARLLEDRGGWRGLTGTISTDIPIGAGLSSSAALDLAVAVALGFDGSSTELIELARLAEHAATGVPTGLLDQTAIVLAREGCATVIDVAAGSTAHVALPDDCRIVVRHIAHRTLVGSGYGDRVRECAAVADLIGPLHAADRAMLGAIEDEVLRRRARHVISENQRVRDACNALETGDLAAVGSLMLESHRSLSDDFEVSTPAMDAAVATLAATPGVFGARMTGGGFGGCVVALCAPDAVVEGWQVRPVSGVMPAS